MIILMYQYFFYDDSNVSICFYDDSKGSICFYDDSNRSICFMMILMDK